MFDYQKISEFIYNRNPIIYRFAYLWLRFLRQKRDTNGKSVTQFGKSVTQCDIKNVIQTYANLYIIGTLGHVWCHAPSYGHWMCHAFERKCVTLDQIIYKIQCKQIWPEVKADMARSDRKIQGCALYFPDTSGAVRFKKTLSIFLESVYFDKLQKWKMWCRLYKHMQIHI